MTPINRRDHDDDEPPFTFGEEPGSRTLSRADVEAIAGAIERHLSRRIVLQAGRGVIKLALHGLLLMILALAAYGIADSFFSNALRTFKGH